MSLDEPGPSIPLDDESAHEQIFRLQLDLHDLIEGMIADTPRPLRRPVRWWLRRGEKS